MPYDTGWKSRCSNLGRSQRVSPLPNVQTGSEVPSAWVKRGRNVMLIAQLHLSLRLRMGGAITLLPPYAFAALTGTISPYIFGRTLSRNRLGGSCIWYRGRRTEVKAEALHDTTHPVCCYSAADQSCTWHIHLHYTHNINTPTISITVSIWKHQTQESRPPHVLSLCSSLDIAFL
jgi:hypothetical protein